MKLFKRMAAKISTYFAKLSPGLSAVVVYSADGHTRYFTTARLDTASAKKLIKHLFRSESVWLVEVDGEPFYQRGTHVKRLNG